MIAAFEQLTPAEKALLYKAPVIFSAHELSAFRIIKKAQQEDAAKLAHIKTYTEHSLLVPYYSEVEKDFKKKFETYTEQFIPFTEESRALIKKDMDRVNAVIDKLDGEYGALLRKSLRGYALHVKKAAHTVFRDIIFPVAFSKL